jgi:hypothetical protein
MNVAGLDMAVDDRVVLAVNGTMTEGKNLRLIITRYVARVWISVAELCFLHLRSAFDRGLKTIFQAFNCPSQSGLPKGYQTFPTHRGALSTTIQSRMFRIPAVHPERHIDLPRDRMGSDVLLDTKGADRTRIIARLCGIDDMFVAEQLEPCCNHTIKESYAARLNTNF